MIGQFFSSKQRHNARRISINDEPSFTQDIVSTSHAIVFRSINVSRIMYSWTTALLCAEIWRRLLTYADNSHPHTSTQLTVQFYNVILSKHQCLSALQGAWFKMDPWKLIQRYAALILEIGNWFYNILLFVYFLFDCFKNKIYWSYYESNYSSIRLLRL